MPSSAESAAPVRQNAGVLALLIVLVVIIFAFYPATSVPFATIKSSVVALGAIVAGAVYILTRLGRGNIVFPSSALVGALWLPAVAYLASALFSPEGFSSALWGSLLAPDTLGFMLAATVLGAVATLAVRRSDHYRRFFTVGAYVFGVLAALSLAAVIIGQFAPRFVSPAFSPIGSFADLASVLGLGTIITLVALRFLTLSSRARGWLTGVAAVSLFLIALANDSAVWTMLALVSLGFFVEAIMRRSGRGAAEDSDLDDATLIDESSVETRGAALPLGYPLVVLAVSLFFLLGSALSGALAGSLHMSSFSVRPSWQSTFTAAQHALETSPVFGSGPGTFGATWLASRDASLNATQFWNANFSSGVGFVPTSFATTGLLGVAAWILFFAFFLVIGLRMLLRRTPEDPFVRFTAVASFLGALYLFTLATVMLPSATLLVLAFVFAGIFISTTRYAARGHQWGVIFSRSPRLGFVIVFVLTILLLSSIVAAYALAERYLAVVYLSQSVAALSAGSVDAADQAAQKSLSFAPSAGAYQVEIGVATSRLSTIAASSTMDAATAKQAYQTALSSGVAAGTAATAVAPGDYQSWVLLGGLYAQAVQVGVPGAYAKAQDAYSHAQALDPTDPQIPYAIAQLNLANKDTKGAEAALKQAVALKPDYTDAVFLLSQLQAQNGELKDALNSALQAAYFTPNNPSILFQIGVLYVAQGNLTDAAAAFTAAVQANSQFANARYLLAAIKAKQGDTSSAITELQAIAKLSSSNATALAPQIADLEAGKDPFPANLLTASSTPAQ